MKQTILALATLLFPIFIFSQATFIIQSLPDNTPPTDQIYIAGSMTGWNPGLPDYALEKNEEEKWTITLGEQPEGTLMEYKFTRGTWQTVEKGPSGEEIGNRQFTYGNGDTVDIIIHNWASDPPGGGSTASDNVTIMDESFYMPQLDRYRRIWVYLPPGYDGSDERYPVLYMHDGQNLFDAATSFVGEWEVDETLNNLASKDYMVPIVVGIDNGGEYRLDEYSPWFNPGYGGGEGEKYIQFIIETLKPHIDENYRTLSGREHTGIMGSSMGGLISHFGALGFSNVFSKAGIFSPSYWYSDSVWAFTSNAGYQHAMRIYLMCGNMESFGTLQNVLKMEDTLYQAGFFDEEITSKIVPGGQHNEMLWRGEFEEAYLWLFGSYANDVYEPGFERIALYPNPVRDYIFLPDNPGQPVDSLVIFDVRGNVVMEKKYLQADRISVTGLIPGLYVVIYYVDGKMLQGRFVKV
jgi:predicted alpha/beta superfamily hydrolase